MKYKDGMKIKDISILLSTTPSAVKMRLARTKEKTRMIHNEVFPEE